MAKIHRPKGTKKTVGHKPAHHVDVDKDDSSKKGIYYHKYKQLLIIPMIMLLAAIILISVQYVQTGDFIHRGISLKGGTSFTLTSDVVDLTTLNANVIEAQLMKAYPQSDITVRELKDLTTIVAISIDVDLTDEEHLTAFKHSLISNIEGLTLEGINKNVQTTGSTLGSTFFKQIMKAILIAFILMGIVVFIQFRVIVPSFAVVLAALSDIIVTLAITNILGIKLSTAGIAAFLMLIGYSVDTDVLLSTRVLKGKNGTVYDRIMSSMKTGLVMNVTTLAAVGVALLVSQSAVINQIMTILFIGLIVDMINTWIQNAGILRYYTEKMEAKK